jgi:hypothetical protein
MGEKPILTVLKAEGHSADTGAVKFPLVSMGGRAVGLACADPGARTPIGASGNFKILFPHILEFPSSSVLASQVTDVGGP